MKSSLGHSSFSCPFREQLGWDTPRWPSTVFILLGGSVNCLTSLVGLVTLKQLNGMLQILSLLRKPLVMCSETTGDLWLSVVQHRVEPGNCVDLDFWHTMASELPSLLAPETTVCLCALGHRNPSPRRWPCSPGQGACLHPSPYQSRVDGARIGPTVTVTCHSCSRGMWWVG